MHDRKPMVPAVDKTQAYREICAELQAVIETERDPIANLANAAALLFERLPELNWAGFYLVKPGEHGPELVVGPYQGKLACTRIALGKGVCGTSAQRRETLVVADVHVFDGHIACDSASNSEIVVPMVSGDTVLGVLDLDSPHFGRFDNDDRAGLEAFVDLLVPKLTL